VAPAAKSTLCPNEGSANQSMIGMPARSDTRILRNPFALKYTSSTRATIISEFTTLNVGFPTSTASCSKNPPTTLPLQVM
jgi:hypothetical protein